MGSGRGTRARGSALEGSAIEGSAIEGSAIAPRSDGPVLAEDVENVPVGRVVKEAVGAQDETVSAADPNLNTLRVEERVAAGVSSCSGRLKECCCGAVRSTSERPEDERDQGLAIAQSRNLPRRLPLTCISSCAVAADFIVRLVPRAATTAVAHLRVRCPVPAAVERGTPTAALRPRLRPPLSGGTVIVVCNVDRLLCIVDLKLREVLRAREQHQSLCVRARIDAVLGPPTNAVEDADTVRGKK